MSVRWVFGPIAVFIFFLFPLPIRAETASYLVISQVQVAGGAVTNDFIELYNPTSSAIDVSGWQLKKRIKSGTESSVRVFAQGKSIPAHGYFLWANSNNDYHLGIGADESSGATIIVDNSVALFNNNGVLIDALAWGSEHNNPFIEGVAASAPLANQSIERRPGGEQGNGEDSNNNYADFLPSSASHPRNSQSSPQPPLPPPPPPPPTANPGDIFINEFVSDPITGESEWIELYNKTAGSIDVSGWYIEEGSGSKTSLSGSILPSQFLVFSPINGNLNNSGDTVYLKRADGVEIDKVIYGDGDGSPDDNAPSAADPNSIARKTDGQDSGNDSQDFAETTTPTKGASNIFPELFEVIEIIDGDTLKLITGEKVRLIGIDTPETGVYYYQEAKDKLGELVLNKEVRLEKDVSETDRYDRLLRYIYLDDLFVNLILIQEGYAKDYPYPPDTKYKDEFVTAETQAKNAKLGIWSQLPSFQQGDVVINEFLSNPSEGKEWIELYINKSSDIDLEGWKISDNTAKTILPLSGVLTTSTRFVIFELSDRLNNDGDIIILKSPDGATIDSVSYGAWNDGNIADNAPVTTKSGQSVSRKSNGGDTGIDSADFAVSDSPTKGVSNVITVTETVGGTNIETKTSMVPKAILYINEFVSDPSDGEEEWVEVYDAGETSVDLSGWYIEEGSGGKTKLSGTLIPGQFFVAGPISGNLNNGGDVMYLKDGQGNIFDRVAYGSWDDGNVSDNAPVASDPASVARTCDGCDTKNNSKDFRVSFTPTRGKGNVAVSEGEMVGSAKILISEILPDPAGVEAAGEFIELQNMETRAVNLAGWYLKDASGTRYVFGNFMAPASGFLAVWRSQSKIALNNNKETVTLFSPDDTQRDQVASAAAKPGQSYSFIDGKWQWTSEATPGKANVLKNQNHPPVISVDAPTAAKNGESVEIDAGDSSDPDGDALTFAWKLGGEIFNGSVLRHTFDVDGPQTVALEISDGKETAKKDFTIAVGDSIVAPVGSIFISEVLPDPEGSDTQEWIEFFYDGESPLDLDGFRVDDAEGGSRPYTIQKMIAAPHSFLVLERSVTSIAFNNEGDSVRLFDPAGKMINETVYTKSSVGLSWSRQSDGSFAWRAPTKGEVNSDLAVAEDSKSVKGRVAAEFALSEVRDESLGARVKVRGTVAVPPGVLGSQIFYLSGSGIQIYMNKKDFPEMQVGDVIEVQGELSEARGERRIKVSAREDMKVVKSGTPPLPHVVSSADIGEEYEGNLVVVEGTIIERKGTRAVLDDGNGEVTISLKSATGIDGALFPEGSQVRVIGILGQRGDAYEVMPRFTEDVEIVQAAAEGGLIEAREASSKQQSHPYALATVGVAGIAAAGALRGRIARLIASAALFGLLRSRRGKDSP